MNALDLYMLAVARGQTLMKARKPAAGQLSLFDMPAAAADPPKAKPKPKLVSPDKEVLIEANVTVNLAAARDAKVDTPEVRDAINALMQYHDARAAALGMAHPAAKSHNHAAELYHNAIGAIHGGEHQDEVKSLLRSGISAYHEAKGEDPGGPFKAAAPKAKPAAAPRNAAEVAAEAKGIKVGGYVHLSGGGMGKVKMFQTRPVPFGPAVQSALVEFIGDGASGDLWADITTSTPATEAEAHAFIKERADRKDKPPGGGWQNIPGGKVAGGKRRRKGKGWEYWYPGKGVTHAPHHKESDDVHRAHNADTGQPGEAEVAADKANEGLPPALVDRLNTLMDPNSPYAARSKANADTWKVLNDAHGKLHAAQKSGTMGLMERARGALTRLAGGSLDNADADLVRRAARDLVGAAEASKESQALEDKFGKERLEAERLAEGKAEAQAAAAGDAEIYTYGAYHRPVSSITVPDGYVTTGDHGDFKQFGTVTYNRPLTRKERSHYSLKLIPTTDQVGAIAREISADLEDYAAEHLEDYADDPKGLEIGIGQALDRLDVNVRREDMVPVVLARLREVAAEKAARDKAVAEVVRQRKGHGVVPDQPKLKLQSPKKAEKAKAAADEKYQTTGYVFGSRAELHDLRTNGLLEADPAVARKLVTKTAVLGGKVEVDSFAGERDKGVEPAAAYLKYQLMLAIQNKPPDSPVMRERFVEGIGRLQASLAECHTLEEVQTFMGEWKDAMEGRYQTTVIPKEQLIEDGFEILTKPPPEYDKPVWREVWDRHYQAIDTSRTRYGTPSDYAVEKARTAASEEYRQELEAAQRRSGYSDYQDAYKDFGEYLEAKHGKHYKLKTSDGWTRSAGIEMLPDGSVSLIQTDPTRADSQEQLEMFQALGKKFTSMWGRKIEYKANSSVGVRLRVAMEAGTMTRGEAFETQEKTRVISSTTMKSKHKKTVDEMVESITHLATKGKTEMVNPGGSGTEADPYKPGPPIARHPGPDADAAWAHWMGAVSKKKTTRAAPEKKGPDYHALLASRRGDQQTFAREGGAELPEATTVSSAEFKAKYGLREAEYGRNAADPVREFHTRGAYTALHDLADVLGLEPADVGRKGRLTIGFASRGKGGRAAATYTGAYRVINMTAKSGKGSLAHEWAHFMDHMISAVAQPELGSTLFHSDLSGTGKVPTAVSETVMSPTSGPRKALHGVSQEVTDALEDVMHAIMHEEGGPASRAELLAAANASVDKVNAFRRKGDYTSDEHNKAMEESKKHRRRYKMASPYRKGGAVEVRKSTSFYQAAKKMGDYWSRPHEMFARSFEAWVSDELDAAGRKNTYLCKGTDIYPDHPGYFPGGEHRKKIGRHMRALVNALKAAGQFQKAMQQQVDALLKSAAAAPRLTMRGC
jgi:hypothetical protein